MIGVAVLGYGIVGSGVVEVLTKNKNSITQKSGEEIVVKKILDIRDFNDDPYKEIITKDPEEIFNDDEINIIVETIGGIKAAYEFTKRSFLSGRHVVTSNKELVATHGPELLKLASENGVNYLFEASVGGGIPIIRPLNQCLAANEIDSIMGILNGTTNYILTKMKLEGADFKDALKSAQENGYAEADPTADIAGHDACRKIAILSSIAFNEYVDYRKIYTEGISNISKRDIEYAETMNSVIKLIAMSERQNNLIMARVSPVILPRLHPLAGVDDVFNAIVVKGNVVGDAMFYGRGAGKLPTASAVVADVIDIVKHADTAKINVWNVPEKNNIISIDETFAKYYIRASVRNYDEARRYIELNFNKVEFITNPNYSEEEIVFITSKQKEKELREKTEKLNNIASVRKAESVIRVVDEY